MIAVQRLFSWLGSLLGIDLSGIGDQIGGEDFSDLIGDSEDLSDGLGKAADNAKKLKGNLQGFDKLNVITSQDTSGGAAGAGAGLTDGLLDKAFEDALKEYQKKWDEAFANMENRAQEMADKIEKALQPIKDIIQDFAVGDFFQAGQDVSNLVVSITDFFARAIDSVDWYGIGEKIGSFLDGIKWKEIFLSVGNFLEKAISAAIELWKGSFSADPISTTIVTALGIAHFTGLNTILKDKIISAIPATLGLKSLTVVIAAVTWEIGFDVGKSLGKALFPEDAQYYENFTWFGEGGFFDEISKDWGTTLDALKNMFTDFNNNPVVATLMNVLFPQAGTIANAEKNFDKIKNIFSELKEKTFAVFSNLWGEISAIWNIAAEWFGINVIEPIANFFGGLEAKIKKIFEGLWITVQAVWEIASEWFNKNVITPIFNLFNFLWEGIKSVWSTVAEWFNKNVIIPVTDFFKGVWANVSMFFTNLWDGIKDVWGAVSSWFENTIIKPVLNAFKAACDKIGGFFSSLWSGIKKGIVGAMNGVIGAIEGGLNWLVDGINAIISGFNRVVSWAADIIEVNWKGVDLVPKVSLGRINIEGYELGGFTKEYSLFMAGEYGRAEMLGTVGGKTAVAGGAEITGIRDAVYSTSQQEIELLRQQNQLLQAILEKEYGISEREIGKAARNYALEYYHTKGENAYIF